MKQTHKTIPTVVFEKDLPSLLPQNFIPPHFGAQFFVTMFGAAAILTVAVYIVMTRLFGEDFMAPIE